MLPPEWPARRDETRDNGHGKSLPDHFCENMRMKQSVYQRFGWLLILAATAAFPVVLFGASEALKNKNNSVRQWLHDGFAETRQYDWFVFHFGSEEFALVSWP